ncbi:hypothetical protein MJO28_008636 [Puccinia striiformis f. sp. tritici]|uniref:Uncharacterized protein n=3 Tax=Puccinia striiformis TaxID=27350 RepID=A0A0L0VLD3_9BASI|nr:hypothetical protein MJO28_008636 [Puccinia striiformis f. sp. tritici]KAI7952889.1 hypothetical protein MJO29_008520 [Puccinia striiformis f. sp. tritici]KNE99824.1 hypothetical protein PSTG_06913 [Puccinia striiformis f. sp. tritici PST-78]POW04152.1 hypothetical protein PSTT_10593 [Puccinia striiformis]
MERAEDIFLWEICVPPVRGQRESPISSVYGDIVASGKPGTLHARSAPNASEARSEQTRLKESVEITWGSIRSAGIGIMSFSD